MSHQRIKGNTDCRGIAQLDANFKSVLCFPKLCFKADLKKYAHGREGGGRKGTRCFGVDPTNSGAQKARI